MIFRQLFESESSTYTYILGDPKTKEGIVIDPVVETAKRDLDQIKDLGLTLRWILDTHVHADHITGASQLKKLLQDDGNHPNVQTAISAAAGVTCVDRALEDDEEIRFGGLTLLSIATPGHTDSCMSFYLPLGKGLVFTGDTLLIRGCGRTDFQQGDAEKLYQSVKSKLFKLPNSTLVFPAHNYQGISNSSIEEERAFNPRLNDTVSLEKFQSIMENLNLDQPKKIDQALPANLKCGRIN